MHLMENQLSLWDRANKKIIFQKTLLFIIILKVSSASIAQDTFSIVAADSASRKVGSAGASCVNLISFGITDAGFLGDLLPDTGAINTQSFYLAGNQQNARIRMRAGDAPDEIISWLTTNDAAGNSGQRQYGVAGFVGASAAAAGFTGSDCFDYKNHITGSINGIAYAIQGNILLNQAVLDSMEAKFRNTDGGLECRLMAALQGANVIGADTRCAQYYTSSLFAFLKVAEPNDQYGFPSFNISVISNANLPFEPIDSLQKIFIEQMNCNILSVEEKPEHGNLKIYPNPGSDAITIAVSDVSGKLNIKLLDIFGRIIIEEESFGSQINLYIAHLPRGVYFLKANNFAHQRLIKN
jgi:uncharacterized Ntn-hydrolase superfamily protein